MNTETQDLPEMERIKNFPDYSITKCGRVFSTKRESIRELKQYITGHSRIQYLAVRLYGYKAKQIAVHKLMAIQFLDHKPCGHIQVIDHIDDNPKNNDISNLRMVSNRENCTKGVTSRSLPRGVHLSGCGYKAVIKHKWKQYYLGTFSTTEEASQAYQERLAEIESEAK